MKAIAVINDTLQDLELPAPQAGAPDLLVQVAAISVNPVDHKMRAAPTEDGSPRVLGWDVAGTVTAVGAEVTLFKVGDQVYYAGSLVRPGANSQYHVVDERIVAHKPSTLDFTE